MKSPYAAALGFVGEMRRQTVKTGASTPSVRGSNWHRAVVATVGSDGTVTTTDGIVALRTESYHAPLVGDIIRVSISSTGSCVAEGRMATAPDVVGQQLPAYKLVSTARASNTTNTADPDLQVPVTAGALYKIDGWIITSNTVMAGDLKCTVTGPTGALGRWQLLLPSTTAAADPDAIRVASAALGSTLSYGNPTAGQTGGRLSGTIAVAATAGTCAFSWAQQTSDTTATNVLLYSWMTLTRMA